MTLTAEETENARVFRAMRRELDLTQTALGERLGLGRLAITRRELGQVPVLAGELLALKHLLNANAASAKKRRPRK